MILLIASKVDNAGMNIAHQLLANHDFRKTSESLLGHPVYTRELGNGETAKLTFIEQEPIDTQSLLYPSPLKLLIFISRHRSKSGIPTLSVHTPGNIGNADLGGLPKAISISPASAMKEALKAMMKAQDEMNLKYEVSYECTHHGPSLNIPTMFVELGSSPKQWKDTSAAEAVARGAMAAASHEKVYPAVLGIGGPHYSEKFTGKALTSEIAFGHIIPKYSVGETDRSMLRQCIDRTVEPVKKVLLDWKGIKGADKPRLLNLLAETGLEVEKT